jgi:hypothetical protein
MEIIMRLPFPSRGLSASAVSAFAWMAHAAPAHAHVKWFAPYIVGAEPQPVTEVLGNPYLWLGLGLVMTFFIVARLVEASPWGQRALGLLDAVTLPLCRRRDDFAVAMIAGFFIAIFAVGGVYLTPDLKTSAGWVSWAQLAIAVGAFSRRTMPLSAAGIAGLWVMALRDYELFHLLDYLALGLGACCYLVLASSPASPWHRHRFAVFRWAVAISLMWSSLEKFAYPDWFYPLVVEKPFLTFGLPRDMFIPMAGVAEFTLGFGLLWTPLIRRLSALALLIIFTAAIYPFGRMDLIGHALIMTMLVTVIVDPRREASAPLDIRRALGRIPAGLAAALVSFSLAYWGLHGAIYPAGPTIVAHGSHDTHSDDPDHPHAIDIVTAPDTRPVRPSAE